MKSANRRSTSLLLVASLIGGFFGLFVSVYVYAQTVTISDSFNAGTAGNAVVFEISNNTSQRVSGVRLIPELPIQYCTLTEIKPESVSLEPGESVEFTVEFSVIADAPAGATDTITLFFETNEKIEIDHPRYQIKIDIVGSAEKRKHNIAYFKVLVEGSGYIFTYGDGTYEVSGSEERYIVVNRGQSAKERLQVLKEMLDGVPCERVWPGQGVGAEVGAPGFFTHGSQITIVDGPYYDFNEFFGNVKFKKNWRMNGKHGPSPKEMAKRIGCGQ